VCLIARDPLHRVLPPNPCTTPTPTTSPRAISLSCLPSILSRRRAHPPPRSDPRPHHPTCQRARYLLARLLRKASLVVCEGCQDTRSSIARGPLVLWRSAGGSVLRYGICPRRALPRRPFGYSVKDTAAASQRHIDAQHLRGCWDCFLEVRGAGAEQQVAQQCCSL
jgi:hypothetical protein